MESHGQCVQLPSITRIEGEVNYSKLIKCLLNSPIFFFFKWKVIIIRFMRMTKFIALGNWHSMDSEICADP